MASGGASVHFWGDSRYRVGITPYFFLPSGSPCSVWFRSLVSRLASFGTLWLIRLELRFAFRFALLDALFRFRFALLDALFSERFMCAVACFKSLPRFWASEGRLHSPIV